MLRPWLVPCFVGAIFATTATAQFTPGNAILLEGGALVELDLSTGTVQNRIPAPLWFEFEQPIVMDRNNADIVAVLDTGVRNVVRVSPAGAVNRIAQLPGPAAALAFGDDGLMFAASTQAGPNLYRYGSTQPTTLYPAYVNDAVIDPVTGDYLVDDRIAGRIVRVDRVTGAVTSLAIPISTVGGTAGALAASPRGGVLAVAGLFSLQLVDRSNTQIGFLSFASQPKVDVNPVTGDFVILPETMFYSRPASIIVVAPDGTVKASWPAPPALDVAVYGMEKVYGRGAPRPGTGYEVRLAFTRAGAGKPYAVLMSAGGVSPGVPLSAGRWLNLVPDGLFSWTATIGDLAPYLRGMRGTTGTGGTATARLLIPSGTPVGTRLFASAIVFDPAAPGGIDVGNTIAIVVR